jgi:predicted nucleic acid-binding Zn ribbon protein
MSAVRPASSNGLALLRDLVKRPIDYGLDYSHASLRTVLKFAIEHPSCVQDGEASASRKINRCLERSLQGKSNADRIQQRIGRQLLEAKEGLAWMDLEHRLSVISRFWNVGRYSRLAKCLCALAAMCRYQYRLFPQAPPYSSNVAAARLALLFQLKQRGWKAVQDHLGRSGLDWRASVAPHLCGTAEPCCATAEGTEKTVRRDQDGNTWMVKYSHESLVNPVLASIFARLSGCPGAEICPSFLDYDPSSQQPCSVQPYISGRPVPRFDSLSEAGLIRLIGSSRRCASQMLCQAVTEWILENIDGNQVVIDGFGNCISIDQDRSFFIDDRRVTTDWQAAWDARTKAGVSVVRAELIEATARIPGVLEDLAAFVARVEAIPAPVYEGLVRNASFREEQLCSLFYLDTMGSGALGSVEALERWIAHLLARKSVLRAALAQRLGEVLGTAEHYL